MSEFTDAGLYGRKPIDNPEVDKGPFVQELTGIESALTAALTEVGALILKKHHDYGSRNISGSPGGPLNGLRVRMYDKLARINNLVDSGAEPENESLRDSFVDMVGYATIGLLLLDGDWPE